MCVSANEMTAHYDCFGVFTLNFLLPHLHSEMHACGAGFLLLMYTSSLRSNNQSLNTTGVVFTLIGLSHWC